MYVHKAQEQTNMTKTNTMTAGKTAKKTIGERAEELATEYFQLFLDFSGMKEHREHAENLALHDLICQKLTYEFAINRLKEKITENREATA